MSKLTKIPTWQRERALILHGEFTRIASAVKYEKAPLVKSLEDLSARIDKTPLDGGKRTLKASAKNLRTLWYQWDAGGRTANSLIPSYTSPKHLERCPDELTAEIQKIASNKTGGRDKHQNGIEGAGIHKKLTQRWRAGESIPGLGTWQEWWAAKHPALPLPPVAPDFPWSVKTVCRRMGRKELRVSGNIGEAAAWKHMPSLKRDYSQLRRCELYTLDDVRLDLMAIDELTGRVETVTAYVLMEVASRCIVAFMVKPKHAIRAEDVDELLACGLQADGYGVGVGYVTHLWFERGTVACTEAAQLALEACSDGNIKVHRTSMDGGISWVGSAHDRSSGHSAGKAVIESFNRNWHRRNIHLPGQRGNNFANQPANLGVGDGIVKDPSASLKGTTVAEAELLAQFKLNALVQGHQADLKIPLMTFSEVQRAVAETIKDHNSERDHGMQGFHQVTLAEVAPGVWNQVSEQ